jgi:Rap1a immunity proteins
MNMDITMRVLAGIFVFLSLCGSATAETTGGVLLQNCVVALQLTEFNKKSSASGLCYGFMEAAQQSIPGENNPLGKEYAAACFPPNVAPKELAKAFILYINNNKDKYDWPAVLVAQNALQAAYPCKR